MRNISKSELPFSLMKISGFHTSCHCEKATPQIADNLWSRCALPDNGYFRTKFNLILFPCLVQTNKLCYHKQDFHLKISLGDSNFTRAGENYFLIYILY